jgi:putative component of membrane protein insertase Oxa1/YidC/SpoIIIJ protein YidD
LLKDFALLLIRGYQRYMSPHKGFSCAYRHYTGGKSCSAFGYRAVRRYGVVKGGGVLRERLIQCGQVFHEHRKTGDQATDFTRPFAGGAKHAQMGFIDGCSGCDGIGAACDATSCACDGLNLLDGCDSCWWWGKRAEREQQVRPMKKARRLFGDS